MFAKINHVAIVSDNYAESAQFYQAVFGMRTSDQGRGRPARVTVGDGYVGLNINPRRAGRAGRPRPFRHRGRGRRAAFERMRTEISDGEMAEAARQPAVCRHLDA